MEQSFPSHVHHPTPTYVLWIISLAALVMILGQLFSDWNTRDWVILLLVMAAFVVSWISRSYTVALQDRIIMLETKVRCAELLPAGQDAHLARLSKKQIAALRFASDAELGTLLERAARENLAPTDIKAAIKSWRPDLHRT